MYRTPGTGRSAGGRGFAGGIFAEGEEGGLTDAGLDDAIEETERGVGPEHLLHRDDQEALAVGRSILTLARAVGGIFNAVTAASTIAAGDVSRHGVRGALARGLRRAAETVEAPRPDRSQETQGWHDARGREVDVDNFYMEADDESEALQPRRRRRPRAWDPAPGLGSSMGEPEVRFRDGSGYVPFSSTHGPTPVERRPVKSQTMSSLDDSDDETDEQIFEAANEVAAGQPLHDDDDEIAGRDLDNEVIAP